MKKPFGEIASTNKIFRGKCHYLLGGEYEKSFFSGGFDVMFLGPTSLRYF